MLQLFRLEENHVALIQAYQQKENELESYRRLLEMHGIWVSFILYYIYRYIPYFYQIIWGNWVSSKYLIVNQKNIIMKSYQILGNIQIF